MTRIGYTLMSEQSGPADLVRYAEQAEAAGFDFEVISDHYFPWLDEQGHSPYAWSVLGAVAQVTERVELMTYVTCPIRRYHPAVVAQAAATVGLLSRGRFVLGLGSGENLNEHVVASGWPPANSRHEMLAEALQVINGLFDGGYLDFAGQHFRVDSAKLWDLPDERVPVAVAVSGEQSVDLFAPLADHLIATEPSADLVSKWDDVHGPGSRKIGQVPVCWDTDEERAVRRAHEQFRWSATGSWEVKAELPGPTAFDAAAGTVRPEDVAEKVPCGPDLDKIVEQVKQHVDAGFTDVAILQVGNENQQEYLDMAAKELLPLLREAFA